MLNYDCRTKEREDNNYTDHVGIVEKVVNGTVYTVEGNGGDAVKENTYLTGDKYIYGYGVPKY